MLAKLLMAKESSGAFSDGAFKMKSSIFSFWSKKEIKSLPSPAELLALQVAIWRRGSLGLGAPGLVAC